MSQQAEEAGSLTSESPSSESPSSESQCAGKARQVLEDLLTRMHLRVKVAVTEDDERIELTMSGQDAGLVVGKKGETLDAMQYLTNRIVSRQGGEHKAVSLDSDGYRERREASLVELAGRLSEKAQDEGKVVALNPMSARDRRIIHITLRDTPGISTRSEGEGELRRLLIVPESASL